MLRGREKNLIGAIVLFAASAASALPSVCATAPVGGTRCAYECGLGTLSSACEAEHEVFVSPLGDIAGELLKPRATAAVNTEASGTRTLPAIPAAIMLGLTGFVCVSAVRDRKAWLAAVALAMWLGQQGVQFVPRLARYAGHRAGGGRQYDSLLHCRRYVVRMHNGWHDQVAEYVGLLRHLDGIPGDRAAILKMSGTTVRGAAVVLAVIWQVFCAEVDDCRSASASTRFVCFTPAFILDLIPRGPPGGALTQSNCLRV